MRSFINLRLQKGRDLKAVIDSCVSIEEINGINIDEELA